MQLIRRAVGRPWLTGMAAVALAAAAVVGRRALASDHQDNPEVELNPAMDMTDFYAFPSATAGRIVLVLNSWAFLTPGQTTRWAVERSPWRV